MSRPRPDPPADVLEAAHARAAARVARDWPRADALKAEIEAAGWKVVDRGTDFRLEPAAAPTIEEDGVVRYGSAAAVPSALEGPPDAGFTVQLLAEDDPIGLARILTGLRAHPVAATQVVIVANDPAPAQAERLAAGHPDVAPVAGSLPEVAWTSTRLGHAAARNVGLRRSRGAVIVLARSGVEPTGDALEPLASALADPTVAVAGAVGLVTADFRRWAEAPGPDVDAISLDWLAFRRADLPALGPLDEKFAAPGHLDAWWSLVLRAGSDPALPPRRAVRVEVPLLRHARGDGAAGTDAVGRRLERRNVYRVLDRFRERPDLRSGGR